MKGSAGISLEEVDFTRTRLPGGGGGWLGGRVWAGAVGDVFGLERLVPEWKV